MLLFVISKFESAVDINVSPMGPLGLFLGGLTYPTFSGDGIDLA